MTYTLGIPDANQSPATQQAPLQTNTNLVDQYFGVDHVRYTAATGQGEHLKVTLTNVQPDPVLVAPKSQLYSKAVSGPADQQLFFANQAGVQQLSGNAVQPIKAWGVFTITAVTSPQPTTYPTQLLQPSFNVQSITGAPADDGNFWVVTMQNALPSTNYVVIATAQAKPGVQGNNGQGYGMIYEKIDQQTFRLAYKDKDGNSRPFQLSGISFLVLGG